MSAHDVEAVEQFGCLLDVLLERASSQKKSNTIEPPLMKHDFADLLKQLGTIDHFSKSIESKKSVQYAVIETAIRDVFYRLLASYSIDDPGFTQMWNLLDIVSILSDDEECDPALLFWLVEELLDSQKIAGCRKIFDYLESRRERITSKHFKQKNLIILRSCNELLRRLSRAEDTAFCGRVFIFMFQSFPLGDKSSVNLRGEYHVENVTTFDRMPWKPEFARDKMDIDSDVNAAISTPQTDIHATGQGPTSMRTIGELNTSSKSVTFNAKTNGSAEKMPDADSLYPVFWALQQTFSQPKKLFAQEHFSEFRKGLEATMAMFKTVQNEQSIGRLPLKSSDESKRGLKRKRGQADEDLANAFNPKYLTSRDLFELEISDLLFRRHILVQALIIMDFLLSLSTKAKEKLSAIPTQNKSVVYSDQLLGEEDIKWVSDMKKSIVEYLKEGYEGPFFNRMVETVLSRDKNWVWWKIELCPTIERPPITAEEYLTAKATARRVTTNRKVRPKPMGSLDLDFLSTAEGPAGMEKLKDPSRYRIPTLESFKDKIALDDLEIDMPTSDKTLEAARNSKASKSWRALRVASKTKLASFDKIENSDKIDMIFQDSSDTVDHAGENENESIDIEGGSPPSDHRPIVVSGPSGAGKGTFITMLMKKHPTIFGKKASHTTRAPRQGETDGVDYNFVDSETYNIMRDGDQFLEHNNFNGYFYGTSRKVVEEIVASGKIPIMEMDYHGIQQLKDQNYSARFVFLGPPNMEELKERLKKRGTESEDKIQDRLRTAKEEILKSESEGFHDKIIVNDDLDRAFQEFEEYIFGGRPSQDASMESQMQTEAA